MFHVEQLEWIPQALAEKNMPIHPNQVEQFQIYHRLLLEWNQRISLISRADESRIVTRHFLESIGLLTVVDFPLHARVFDIGSGGGFPGLPLKIVRPDLQMVLVESKAKKARFLERVVEELGISGIEIIAERVERLKKRMDSFHLAVIRAVADVSTVIQWLVPFVSSSPRLKSPILGFFIFSIYLAYTSPITANCNKFTALQSGVAPTSRTTNTPYGEGITTAIAGLSTPARERHLIFVAATAAPVFPAEKKALATPSLTRDAHLDMEESFFLRSANTGVSYISTI